MVFRGTLYSLLHSQRIETGIISLLRVHLITRLYSLLHSQRIETLMLNHSNPVRRLYSLLHSQRIETDDMCGTRANPLVFNFIAYCIRRGLKQ